MNHSKNLSAVYDLHVPEYDQFAKVLKNGLSANFAEVECDVRECPDLRQEPFHLAARGLCGRPRIADVGGPNNMTPVLKKDKIFDLSTVCETCELPEAFVIGPGAGPYREIGMNCELITNCCFGNPRALNSYIAKITSDGGAEQQQISSTEFAILANLFLCEGKQGKAVYVRAKTRTGEDNFVSCMRKALEAHYGQKPVGVGGAFLIKSGKAKMHVMPDFFESGFYKTDEEIFKKWLRFFDMSAPLVSLSVFHSYDPGYNLRPEHTHCFSLHGEGGHYHYDVTPDTVEYEGYFVPCEKVFRIDQV